MKLVEVKHTTVELTDEEIKAIKVVHNLVNDLEDSMKDKNYDRVIVDSGYGDYESLSTGELLDLSEMLSRLKGIFEMR